MARATAGDVDTSPDSPYVPFAVEEVLFYRHLTPVPWLRLEKWLKIGHNKKMRNTPRVLHASIA